MKSTTLSILLFFSLTIAMAQSDKDMITETLMDYIEGTSQGQPERIKKAFHPDLNLYSINEDESLRTLSGQRYIGYFKPGEKNERIGKIVSIDVVNNAAMAKVEIDMPSRKRLYTDYMMLLKINGHWTIVHKSFTWENY